MMVSELEKTNADSVESTAERPASVEAQELDEASLKEWIGQAGVQVDENEKQVLDGADRNVVPPPSLSIEQSKADTVLERGGFAERIQGIKDKITALAQATKERITALMGSGPEPIHFSQMVGEVKPVEPKTAEIQAAETPVIERNPPEVLPIENKVDTVVVTEKAEGKEETAEQKEQRELKEYLEREVFAKFDLTPEAEAKAIAEAPENRREILARSFENTRNSLQVFYEQETIEGTLDRIKAQRDLFLKRTEATTPVVQEELSKRGFTNVDLSTFGLTEASRGKTESTTPDYAVEGFLDEQKRKAKKEAEAKISDALLKEGRYRDIVYDRENPKEMDDQTYEKFKSYVDEEFKQTLEQRGLTDTAIREIKSKVEKTWFGVGDTDISVEFRRKTFEEVTEQLQSEKELADKTNFLCVNIGADKLETVFQQGGFRDIFNLTEAELEEMERVGGRGGSFYFNQRKATEEGLGIYDPNIPTVYGTYASENGSDEKRGGADVYGSIFLKLKPEVQAVFCEGDSMSGSNFIGDRKVKQLGVDKLNYPEYARARQIAPEHAATIQAMNNLFMKIENSLGNSVSSFGYLEAHIKGVRVEDIASINIPEAIATGEQIAQDWGNYKKFVERLQADPQWKDKINIIKNAQ